MTTSIKPVELFTLKPGKRYIALSQSQPGAAYEIVIHSQQPGDISCGCKGFQFRRSCKHVAAVEAQLAAARDAEWRADLATKISDLYN
jgi:uncharacterized Zn finger protein